MSWLSPQINPRIWIWTALILGGAVGLAAGVGSYTFIYAKGASYLTNDPQACANCHVMDNHLDSWAKSSHHAVAVCNDCHTPHDFFGKYTTKALNGWHHSVAFTTGRFHEPIRITDRNLAITEAACRDCHSDITEMIDAHAATDPRQEPLSCVRCHDDVGHMSVDN